jgi:SAM-dependent methyltransferase
MSRAVRVGRLVAVACPGGDGLAEAVDRLASRGFRVRQTPHFVLCQRRLAGQAVLLHRFDESTIDEDISPIVGEELGSVGAVTSPREYGEALFAVVASTCPSSLDCPECGRLHLDRAAIWRHFSLNTLARLRACMSGPLGEGVSHTAVFGAIYRRVFECRVGESLLDVGSNLGHLPVLLSELAGDVTVVGCDNRRESIVCCEALAAATGARVSFRLADVLARDFGEIGTFDTVTAVHVLEHLTEDELPAALTAMLGVTARRLIVSVPYEEVVQPLYGHRQSFTPEKLGSWGEWCVEALAGGRFACEYVGGGFLVVDRD